jgi:multidrug efflux pump subunit AcrB
MIKYLIRHPVSVFVIFAAVIVVSVVALIKLPTSLLPAIDLPELLIKTDCGKMSAEDVSRQVAPVLVSKLVSLPGLDKIVARSEDGYSVVNIRFVPGTDMNTSFYEAAERIESAIRLLPSDVSYPAIVRRGFSDIPVCFLTVSLRRSPIGKFSPSQPFFELTQWVNNSLIPALEQSDKIAFADASGLETPKIIVVPKPGYLQAGLTPEHLARSLTLQNKELQSIKLRDNNVYVNYSVGNPANDIETIKNTLVEFGGSWHYLHNVADVQVISEPKGFCLADGRQTILVALYKKEGASLRDFRRSVDYIINAQRMTNPAVEITLVRAQDTLVNQLLTSLFRSLLLGVLFVVLIILLGYRQLRLASVILISVSVSVILTFLLLYLMRISLNIISIAGLIVSIGLAIDFGIIVSDNILQRYKTGLPLRDAIAIGTQEVIAPVLSSAFTTAAIFIPLIFISGYAGMLFFDQAFTIVSSQAAAIITALFLLPVLFKVFINEQSLRFIQGSKKNTVWGKLHKSIERSFLKSRKVPVITIGIVLILGPIGIFFSEKRLYPSLPYTEREICIHWNEPLTPEANFKRMVQLSSLINNHVVHHEIFAGRQDFLYGENYDFKENESCIFFATHGPTQLDTVTQFLSNYLRSKYPEASFSFRQPLSPITKVFNADEEKVYIKLLLDNENHFDVSKIDSLENDLKNNEIEINELPVRASMILLKPEMEKIAVAGITPEDFYQQVNNYMAPAPLMQLPIRGSRIPVYAVNASSISINHLLEAPIHNSTGSSIELGNLVKTSMTSRIEEYFTDASGTFVLFSVQTSPRLNNKLNSIVANLNKGRYQGKLVLDDYNQENRAQLIKMIYILIISILLLYLILAAQFESLIIPLIVLIELPIDYSFVMLALWVTSTGLNLMSFIGLIVISGLVINDSILKIDKIIQEARSGRHLIRAVITGGRARLNSIIITSLTTILAVVPQMWGNNVSTALQNPVSLAIVIGLGAGTLVSIYLIPALFYFIYSPKQSSLMVINP